MDEGFDLLLQEKQHSFHVLLGPLAHLFGLMDNI